MDAPLSEWLNAAFRWIHVFAAILWIGQTWLFIWMENRLSEVREPGASKAGPIWMVHGGGFYLLEKQMTLELQEGRKLHWFKYEALITFISGFGLFLIVYYFGGALVIPESIGVWGAIGLAVLYLAGGWIVYDLICRSPIGRSDTAVAVVVFVGLVATAFGLSHVMGGRAMFLHVGALMGTLMAANVWLNIIPNQRKVLAAKQAGKEPDMRLADQAKLRSKHNSFMVLPVLFLMLSNHLYSFFSTEHEGAVLAGVLLVGGLAAKVLRSR